MDATELEKLATLSRLALTDQDRNDLLPAVSAILAWADGLHQAPTSGVTPMAHPHDLALRLRDDQPETLPSRDALMANAPQASHGLFVVPRVVE
ncbi:MAG: Asp-tRNA(Asn)/Glu-tRNA(Gln) amidotransferase subunit GatC [Betaproteobacteria bacterium]|jgi:aspartyl-tRNA(Asn)/glutamyl-tRNA(Gln) amidotransferase subunit C|nr:Asp-tRNA(Asn)/Glu-tRNA(Gln) amidotransferase subunit GatC [Betaproteobacteria bacterium]